MRQLSVLPKAPGQEQEIVSIAMQNG